jgi:mRNA interferase RelE/StbE
VKDVIFLEPAALALRGHRNVAARILGKIAAYAENPATAANRVTQLRGRNAKRMRVGDFRILFEETATQIIVSDIGPRSSIYK